MLTLVRAPVETPDDALPIVALRVDRTTLAKRRWRGAADDGTDFGFELESPLRHGATVHQTPLARYVVKQAEEAVVEVSLEITPSAAAGIGWAIGNLHLELAAEPTRLIAADEPAVRQLLQRLQVPYRSTTAIFRPGRFARGAQSSHELGSSHKH
jgi:urease accessory protein